MTREAIFPPGQPRPECHAPTICEVEGGEMLAAWYAGSREGAKDVAIYASRKRPGGAAWTEPVVIADTPGFSEGNPVLYRGADGIVWLFYVTMLGARWSTCQVKYRRSADGGHTWSEPVFLREETGWMTSNKPVTLADSAAILLPLYEESGAAFCLRSEDGGVSWRRSNRVETRYGVIQPALALLPDGRILMLLGTYERSEGTIWQTVSDDGGLTWEEPTRSILWNPNARVDVQALAASGALVCAFNDSQSARTPLTLALSDDEGRTWPLRADIASGEGEFSYPALLQSSDGLCHLVYTERRGAIAYVAFDEEWLRGHG